MPHPRTRLRCGLLASLALLASSAPLHADPAPGLPAGTGACGPLEEIPLPNGGVVCSHGADPAPPGIDVSVSQPPIARPPVHPPGFAEGFLLPDLLPGQQSAAAAAPPAVICYGDGQSGARVQAIYARPSNRPDRYAQYVDSIRKWAAETDAVFAASAAKTGAVRHIRFVTTSKCQPVVDNVVLSPSGAANIETTTSELAARGYNRRDRKYLVWMDATELCGIAGYYEDDRPGSNNFNNGNAPGTVARTDAGCWGLANRGESIEAHELMHSLGSVMRSAPHMTAAGHCTDDADRMCYDDGTAIAINVCGRDGEAIFDCNSDDYFHTAPPAGNYLATHWNTARSAFLATDNGIPLVSVSDAAPVVEGDPGSTRQATFTVSLSSPAASGVSVRYSTADGSAGAADDYGAVAGGLVSFPPGQTSVPVSVPVRGDSADENDEAFVVNLSNPSGGNLDDAQGLGFILDDDPKRLGYRFVATDGGIFAYGDAPFYGSTGNIKLNKPIVGMAATPSGQGYWMVATDGGIFGFGDAGFYGSAGATPLDRPVAGMANTPSGKGYWLVTTNGRILPYGDAGDFGSATGVGDDQPVVGMATTPSGKGYWLVTRSGRVLTFGDAANLGSTPPLARPAVDIAASPNGTGYWIVTDDGGVYGFGVPFLGSMAGKPLNRPVVGMSPTASGNGYWLVATDGGIFSFGDATFLGSTGNIKLNKPIVGLTNVS